MAASAPITPVPSHSLTGPIHDPKERILALDSLINRIQDISENSFEHTIETTDEKEFRATISGTPVREPQIDPEVFTEKFCQKKLDEITELNFEILKLFSEDVELINPILENLKQLKSRITAQQEQAKRFENGQAKPEEREKYLALVVSNENAKDKFLANLQIFVDEELRNEGGELLLEPLQIIEEEFLNMRNQILQGEALNIDGCMEKAQRDLQQAFQFHEKNLSAMPTLRDRITPVGPKVQKIAARIQSYLKDLTMLPSVDVFKQKAKAPSRETLEGRAKEFQSALSAYAKDILLTPLDQEFQDMSITGRISGYDQLAKLGADVLDVGQVFLENRKKEASEEGNPLNPDDPRMIAIESFANKLTLMRADNAKRGNWIPNVKGEDAGKEITKEDALPLDHDTKKEILKKAAKHIHETAKELLLEICKLEQAFDKSATTEQVAKQFKETRANLLNQSPLWDPLSGTISFRPGPAQHGKKDAIDLTYQMETLGQPYSCAAPRNRVVGESCTLPNAHHIHIRNEQNEIIAEHSSCSTTVEFMQPDITARYAATRQNTMQLLVSKAQEKWNKLSDKEKAAGTSPEKPLVIETTNVSLLTADTLRQSIRNNSLYRYMFKEASGKDIDDSQLEQRMLNEGYKACMYLAGDQIVSQDKETATLDQKMRPQTGDKIPFVSQDGLKTALVIKGERGEKPVYLVPLKNKETGDIEMVYIQFDVAYYATGCDEWAFRNYKHTTLLSGKGLELEEAINQQGVTKHLERSKKRIASLRQKMTEMQGAVSEDVKKTLHGLMSEAETAQKAWREAELAYHKKQSKSTEAQVKQAFERWQERSEYVTNYLLSQLSIRGLSKPVMEYLSAAQQILDISDLMNEVEIQVKGKDYRKKEFDDNMFTFAASIMSLSCELDENPNIGCRSSRDRTTLARIEIANRFATRLQHGRFHNYKEMEELPQPKENRTAILVSSPLLESAAANIGVPSTNFKATHKTQPMQIPASPVKEIMEGVGHAFVRDPLKPPE